MNNFSKIHFTLFKLNLATQLNMSPSKFAKLGTTSFSENSKPKVDLTILNIKS